MPSKWQFLRTKGLEKFKQEESWQQQIDLVKKTFARAEDGCSPSLEDALENNADICSHGKPYVPLAKLELCQELDDSDNSKDEIEAQLKACNTRREALNQLLLADLEDEGSTTIKNTYGTFFIQDEPYSKVEDKVAYLAWIKDQGLDALLNVPWQSTNAQAKDALQKGENPPPGLKIFIKSTVRRRNA